MDRRETLRRILDTGVLAVVRLRTGDGLVPVAEALAGGGVDVVEFTMTTPGALDALAATASALGDRVVLGAGTVLDAGTARDAVEAGARFIVAPTFSAAVVAAAHDAGAVAIPGAFSPTEILRAWDAGADFVKVFPAGGLGPGYVRDVLAPLPQVRLVPSGGVDLGNAGAFIAAGAAAISAGSGLVDPVAVAGGNLDLVRERAVAFRAAVVAGRQEAAARG